VEESFRSALLKTLRRELSLNDTQPPQASEAVHAKYCPRCLQQFTAAAETCPDCGGRELLKFESSRR
jgi:rRNA maturation endonuclease Nob1